MKDETYADENKYNNTEQIKHGCVSTITSKSSSADLCLSQKSRSKIHRIPRYCKISGSKIPLNLTLSKNFRMQDPLDPTQSQNFRIQDPLDPTQNMNFRIQDPSGSHTKSKLKDLKYPVSHAKCKRDRNPLNLAQNKSFKL